MGVLENKTAIVTGASSGIGRAAAKLFASEGASVVVAARREAELEKLVGEIAGEGGRAIALPGDVRCEQHARETALLAADRFGGLDIAFNNAGSLGALGDATTLTAAGWQETLDVNLSAAFLGAKHQIPEMLKRGGGSIIFTSTFVGYSVGLPGMAAYAAAKSGLIGLTRVLAAEYGASGIRVNALLPGGAETEMAAEAIDSPETRAFVESMHALRRLASPEEIARAALFLASDASSFTTGSAMLVDGGVSVSRNAPG